MDISSMNDHIMKCLYHSLKRYDVEMNMYTKLSPTLEVHLKLMSFLLKITLKHYKSTEDSRKDYVAFKNSLKSPEGSRLVEEVYSAESEVESEQSHFTSKLTERGGKFLAALREVMSAFNQEKKALTLAFVEVLMETVDGDTSKLTREYIQECRRMCCMMLDSNDCSEFALFFDTMHPTNFSKLVQKGIWLSQSRLVGSFPSASTSSGTHQLDFYPFDATAGKP